MAGAQPARAPASKPHDHRPGLAVPVPVPVLTMLCASRVIGFSRANKPDGASSGAKEAPASNWPCEFVGSWTSVRAESGYKVTLGENGQYVADPIASGAYSGATLRGTWRVDGKQMSWNSASRSTGPASGRQRLIRPHKTATTTRC